MIVELTIAQIMNRASIAHLSIERVMKFIINQAGGPLTKNHDLPSQFNELRQHQPESAKFLEEAFHDAIRHYNYNPNAPRKKHLKSLQAYLKATGSDKSFQDIRYWELTQSTDKGVIHEIHLLLHIELLHALEQIILNPNLPKDTVSERVERAVIDAMEQTGELHYNKGTNRECYVKSYFEWVRTFKNCREAIRTAFDEQLTNADDLRSTIIKKVQQDLKNSTDSAVKYFAEILMVLPKQPRDIIPYIEWSARKSHHAGLVSTPGGSNLGSIHRRPDAFWNIIPKKNGPVTVTAIAKSEIDARSYLATILTKNANLSIGEKEKSVRLVGEQFNIFKRDYTQKAQTSDNTTDYEKIMFQVTFWDNTHDLKNDDAVTLKTEVEKNQGIFNKLEGIVKIINGHDVFIQGTQSFVEET